MGKMTKWEYKTEVILNAYKLEKLNARLNIEGQAGWRVVALFEQQADGTTNYRAVFMRPLAQPDVEK